MKCPHSNRSDANAERCSLCLSEAGVLRVPRVTNRARASEPALIIELTPAPEGARQATATRKRKVGVPRTSSEQHRRAALIAHGKDPDAPRVVVPRPTKAHISEVRRIAALKRWGKAPS